MCNVWQLDHAALDHLLWEYLICVIHYDDD